MSAVWPPSLPQQQFIGATMQPQPNVVQSDTDTGPRKLRRRFTKAVTVVTAPLELSGAQLDTFNAFFGTTLADGTLPFEWTDPATDETREYRFLQPPQFRLELGHFNDKDGRRWSGSLQLEIV